MHTICTYHITVRGQMDEADFNATGPVQIIVVKMDASATLITGSTDQSGLIGLIRHLHQQGFVILTVFRE